MSAESMLSVAERNASKAVDRQAPLTAQAAQVQALVGIGRAILELAESIRAAGESKP